MRLLPVITCLTLALLSGTALGEPAAAPATAAVSGLSYTFPLAKFSSFKGPMRLKDADGSAELYFPVSERFRAREAVLSLEFTNSIALLSPRSVLAVRLNGTTVGQIHLDPLKPRGTAQIILPVELLKPGYNQLTFAVAEHYTMECEDPESPELWTEIDTNASVLYLAGDLRADTPMLSQLNQVFSPGLGGIRELSIVTGAGPFDNAAFKAGALVAEGVALRTQYEAVAFPHPQAVTSGDYALVGTTAQLAGLLPKEKLDAIAGPTVAIDQAPGDPTHLRLLVAGRTADETLLAARAFSLMDFPFTDAPQMTVSEIHPANPQLPSMAAQYLIPGRRYAFSDLGLKTATLRTSSTHTIPLTLDMPPDLYGPDQATVDLHLDFAYGAGMGPGSVVNLLLNGNFFHAIHLNNPQGDVFHDYLIAVPLHSFNGGANQLSFEVVMGSETAGRCMERSGRHLIFSLADTSSLVMPDVGHYASQPNLGLFGHTGFPYVAPNEMKNSVLAVLDPALAASGWTLAGKLAQVAKAPLDGMDFIIGWPDKYQHSLVLGPVKALPANVFSAVDYGVGELHKVPYLSLQHPMGEKDNAWTGGALNAIGGKADIDPQPDGNLVQASDLGRNSVILGIPSGNKGTLTLLTARDDDTLAKGVGNLVQPDFWPRLSGTLAVWRDKPDTFASVDLGGKFSLGEKNSMLGVRYKISHWPALWIAGALAGLVALAMLSISLIRGRSRHKGQE